MSSRLRRLTAWLGVLALLLQLGLPTLHAQAWAQRAGTPMLLAMCGQMPGVHARAAGDDARVWQQSQHKLLAACELCASVHAQAMAGPPAAAAGPASRGTAQTLPALFFVAKPTLAGAPPQARGPPPPV